jgi:hypothetical protein
MRETGVDERVVLGVMLLLKEVLDEVPESFCMG